MRGLRVGGHPLHPALVHFPIACWTAAPLLDLAYLLTRNPAWWQAGFWCIAAGVALGLLAMCAGLMDLMSLPAGHAGEAAGQAHMLLMSSAWCLFVVDLLLRPLHGMPSGSQAWIALSLSGVGFLVLAAGGHAGARLVYDFGIGQNRRDLP